MTEFLLIRHGAHDEVGRVLSGRSAIPLNAQGLDQAEALVAGLGARDIAAIYSSPRIRARQTAAPLAAALGLDVSIAEALDEIDFGGFTGRSFAALEGDPAWHEWNSARDRARCPGGETMREAVQRAWDWLLALPQYSGGAIVCVTHCDIIRGVAARATGIGEGRLLELECEPASITTLVPEQGLRLVSINRAVP